jgi:hypothetical protein
MTEQGLLAICTPLKNDYTTIGSPLGLLVSANYYLELINNTSELIITKIYQSILNPLTVRQQYNLLLTLDISTNTSAKTNVISVNANNGLHILTNLDGLTAYLYSANNQYSVVTQVLNQYPTNKLNTIVDTINNARTTNLIASTIVANGP